MDSWRQNLWKEKNSYLLSGLCIIKVWLRNSNICDFDAIPIGLPLKNKDKWLSSKLPLWRTLCFRIYSLKRAATRPNLCFGNRCRKFCFEIDPNRSVLNLIQIDLFCESNVQRHLWSERHLVAILLKIALQNILSH